MKRSAFFAAFMLAATLLSAQNQWTVGIQHRYTFAKSQGFFEPQEMRLEGVENWLYGDLRVNKWAFRAGASYIRTDMGEGLVGFCATPPVMTYPMFQNRLGYRLSAGREFSLGKAGELTAWVELQQHWTWDQQVYPLTNVEILPYYPESPVYLGSNIGIEYTKTFFNHLTVGASVQAGYVYNKYDERMSPFKLGGGLSVGYRF